MGKKTKVGKQRKDKFYHLAKETGYRSRSAFKLLQLNRKFEFLQRARILIDLCAAPGGWLQVAQNCMPVSSLIIGVDLVPIKALPNVITHQEDITTDKCRHVLKKELGTWKADVILNDGAPNVGKNWLHDAFSQAQLTLSALKLAAEFLTKGGWFITKVFRSKDYHALLWVFKLLFKKVHATKPQASRHESAEIFVICQNYIAPDKIDPKFFNPKYLFEEVDPEPKNELNILHPEKEKKKAEGYPEGDYTLHHQLKASEFIHSSNHVELLANCNEIIFDDEKIKDHKLTTNEIKECCKDIKVLGKADLKSLLNWRKKLKEALKKRHPSCIIEPASTHKEENEVNVVEEEEEEEDDDDEILKETETLKEQQAQELKRKKKKILKQKQKLQKKINLKMVIKDDEPLVQQDIELFRLSRIKKKQDLEKLDENDPTIIVDEPDTEPASDNDDRKRKWISYPRDEKLLEWNGAESESEPENEKPKHYSDSEDETCSVTEDNPLLVDLENKKKTAVERWFEKDVFADIENEDDDELELEMIPDTAVGNASNKHINEDDDSDDTEATTKAKEVTSSQSEAKKKKKKRKLDPEGLALGSLMIQSKKTKRDIIDSGYNRYTFGDDNLPDWFVKDEKKHNRKHLPVTPSLVAEYKARLKEINARPIKKVIEAKSRKKKRALRKLEKARKKAEALTETLDMTEKEKAEHIKSIYKKALQKKDKHVTYIVAKKGAGKRVRRPHGVTGKFKVVDRRMKKDKRAIKAKRQK